MMFDDIVVFFIVGSNWYMIYGDNFAIVMYENFDNSVFNVVVLFFIVAFVVGIVFVSSFVLITSVIVIVGLFSTSVIVICIS